MKAMAAVLLAVGMAGPAVLGQSATEPAAESTQPRKPPTQRIVRMTVEPAAEPVPAMKYTLLPTEPDQIGGDAMTLYYVIMDRVANIRGENNKSDDRIDQWLDTAPSDLPKEQVGALLKDYDNVFRVLDLATRQSDCQWNFQVKRLGFDTELPALSRWQYFARVLALRSRLQIAQGHYDDAIHSLRMGLAMAKDAAEGPTFIQKLVGMAMVSRQDLRQIECLIAAHGSPNLYWAIAALPNPFINLTRGLYFEGQVLYWTIPQLADARDNKLTRQQWKALPKIIMNRLQSVFAGQEIMPDIAKGIVPTTVLPGARQYWHKRGLTDKEIDEMPLEQVDMVYGLHLYDRAWQDMIKWSTLPYWQAQAGFRRVDAAIRETSKAIGGGFLPTQMVKYCTEQAMLQQHLAALQTIEAIRIYAATHQGRLPATLAEMTDPPAPITPITGRLLQYEVDGNTFTVNAPAPEGFDVSKGVRYIVTMKQ